MNGENNEHEIMNKPILEKSMNKFTKECIEL